MKFVVSCLVGKKKLRVLSIIALKQITVEFRPLWPCIIDLQTCT